MNVDTMLDELLEYVKLKQHTPAELQEIGRRVLARLGEDKFFKLLKLEA